ncbi:MAG: DUF1150 family protein [Pseudomonadota bacterium]
MTKTTENLVYVREIQVASLPEDVQGQTEAEILYAIHNPDGERIALVDDRKLAFRVARANDLSPVSVH